MQKRGKNVVDLQDTEAIHIHTGTSVYLPTSGYETTWCRLVYDFLDDRRLTCLSLDIHRFCGLTDWSVSEDICQGYRYHYLVEFTTLVSEVTSNSRLNRRKNSTWSDILAGNIKQRTLKHNCKNEYGLNIIDNYYTKLT